MTRIEDPADLTRSAGVSRRSVLAVGAAGASAVALAACTQAKSADRAPGTAARTGAPATAGTSSAATGSVAAGSTAAGSTASAPAASGPVLAKLSSIKVGEAIAATGPDGAKLIISRPTESTAAAFSAICTHQGCVVAPAGKELDCPCHGSVFDATTGAVRNGPATQPLPSINVKVSGDNIIAG
jgi:Rieske Fe-S protein